MSQQDEKRAIEGAPWASLSLLAEALEPVMPDAQQRARLLAELCGPERFAPWARDVAHHFGLPESDARDALRRIPDASSWRPGPWPGSRLLVTEGLLRASAMIACLAPRTRIGQHRHGTRELTFVLDGILFSDGVAHQSGSLLHMPQGSAHAVTVSDDGECLVVFSASPSIA